VGGLLYARYLMARLFGGLVDEVYDCGDHLLIRNEGEEFVLPLSTVINVSSSLASNPARITLMLLPGHPRGEMLAFSPPLRFTFNPCAVHPVAKDLMLRVDAARAERQRYEDA
jgi:hypothetical protein